jgi:iron(III) transport system ATP-binding protein
VLLDEPFSGLDTNMRARIREETLSLLKQKNVATLMVTHDPEEAMFMADRIKVLGEGGRILQAGRPEDIYYRPADEYVARLFGHMNVIDGIVSEGNLNSSFGAIQVDDAEDGRPIRLLIRPEGVTLSDGDDRKGGTPVDVLSSHLLGDRSVVRLQLSEGVNSGAELQARIPGKFDMTAKGQIWAHVDPRHVFQYPQD